MIPVLAISVGDTRTALGAFRKGELVETARVDNADRAGIVDAAERLWRSAGNDASVVLASVNDAVADPLETEVEERLVVEVSRIGRELGAPVGECLDPDAHPGVDRLLNAAAAWDVMRSACVVVDAGTAVTVDFIDGEGVFHGGAIAPGAAMQLDALHEHTAQLPRVPFAKPADEAFGRSTSEAMLQGVYHGLRGLVWRLVERYAQSYGAFPPVIVTGGDAEVLFRDDELIDRIVPDLTLLGIAVAVRRAMEAQSAES